MNDAESDAGREFIALYVGGSGRSGSTLLECLLSRLPGVVALGEVGHLWQRGLLNDERCACRENFSACPFWTRVGQMAFGGWSNVDVEEVLTLRHAVDRQRRMLQSGRRRPPAEVTARLVRYAGYYRAIYQAASQVAGASVVVDSSKVAPTALALSHDRRLDLRVMHIVRDSRGVAYSWTKVVSRPETDSAEEMPRLSPAASSALWLSHNLSISGLVYRGVPVTRLRYEDLVTAPGPTVETAWRGLRLPGAGVLPMIDERTIELVPTHSVAGNPMRFSTGHTVLRPDTAWQQALPGGQRRLVTALTYPALRAFGYR